MFPRLNRWPRGALAGLLVMLILAGCTANSGATPISANPTRGPLPTLAAAGFRPAGAALTVENAPQIVPLMTLRGHTATVNRFAFSRDGNRMFTTDGGGAAYMWDFRQTEPLYPVAERITAAYFSADDETLIAITPNGSLLFLNAADGKLIAQVGGHTDALLAVDQSTDRTLIATGGRDNRILVWDAAGRKRALTLNSGQGAIQAVAISPDGATLAALINAPSSLGGLILRLWRLPSGEPINTLRDFRENPPSLLQYSPDGRSLAIAGRGMIRIYDVPAYVERYKLIQEDLSPERDMRFSPDSTMLGIVGNRDNAYVVRVVDGVTLVRLTRHSQRASGMAWSPNNELLSTAMALPGLGVYIWQVRTFALTLDDIPRGQIARETNGIWRVIFSPDGKRLILADLSGGMLVLGVPAQ